MTTYYRVDLEKGIATEEQKTGFYSKSEELNDTVFKNVRAAKRKFSEISLNEIKRLRALRSKFKGVSTRADVVQAEGKADGPAD